MGHHLNNQQGQQERRRAPVEGQERSRVLLGQELAEVGSRLHSDRALVVEVVERSLLLVVGGSLDQELVVEERSRLLVEERSRLLVEERSRLLVEERSRLLVEERSLDQELVVEVDNQLQLDQDRQAGQDSNHEEGSDSLPQGEEGLAGAEEGPPRYSV